MREVNSGLNVNCVADAAPTLSPAGINSTKSGQFTIRIKGFVAVVKIKVVSVISVSDKLV